MGLCWEQKLEPGHTKLRKNLSGSESKLVGACGGSREAWYEIRCSIHFQQDLLVPISTSQRKQPVTVGPWLICTV